MKAVLLDDRQRKKIVNMVKPSEKDFFSYQNLNLLTAVYDEEKNLYLTCTYYMSSSIMRTGDNYNEYSFALLTPLGCFSVSCTERSGKCFNVFSPLPLLISNAKLKEMVIFYHESFSERRALKKEAQKDIDTGDMSFTEWYLSKNYF